MTNYTPADLASKYLMEWSSAVSADKSLPKLATEINDTCGILLLNVVAGSLEGVIDVDTDGRTCIYFDSEPSQDDKDDIDDIVKGVV